MSKTTTEGGVDLESALKQPHQWGWTPDFRSRKGLPPPALEGDRNHSITWQLVISISIQGAHHPDFILTDLSKTRARFIHMTIS